MNACDYEAQVYDGAVYCTDFPDGVTEDSEGVCPIFAIDEWDHYPVCDHCGHEHDYVNLTEYGQRERYLRAEGPRMQALRRESKAGDELPAFAWPGGFPLVYQTKHGEIVCPKCVQTYQRDEDPLADACCYYEGACLACVECDAEIASAYGDPNSPTDEP